MANSPLKQTIGRVEILAMLAFTLLYSNDALRFTLIRITLRSLT